MGHTRITQIADGVLDEFYRSGDYDRLRKKHKMRENIRRGAEDHKVAAAPRGPLSSQFATRGILKNNKQLKPLAVGPSKSLSALPGYQGDDWSHLDNLSQARQTIYTFVILFLPS